MSRASYSSGVVDGIIWVRDNGANAMSVTNDAEQVVSEVVGRDALADAIAAIHTKYGHKRVSKP